MAMMLINIIIHQKQLMFASYVKCKFNSENEPIRK